MGQIPATVRVHAYQGSIAAESKQDVVSRMQTKWKEESFLLYYAARLQFDVVWHGLFVP